MNNIKIASNISTALTVVLIAVHSIVVLIDWIGVHPQADFMIRPDGSQMNPLDMLPVEQILVQMIAFPFLACLIAFLFASQRSDAALMTATIHALYAIQQILTKAKWDSLFHPDTTSLSTELFIYIHIVWTMVAIGIYQAEEYKTKKGVAAAFEEELANEPFVTPKKSKTTAKTPKTKKSQKKTKASKLKIVTED